MLKSASRETKTASRVRGGHPSRGNPSFIHSTQPTDLVSAARRGTGHRSRDSYFPFFDVVHEILHCQLRVSDHGLARTLEQPDVSTPGPRDSGFGRFPGRFRHAGEHYLDETVKIRKQGLLGATEAKDLSPDLLDGSSQPFLGPDNAV